MTIIQTVSAQTNQHEVIEILERDGCVVIENVLGKEYTETLQADLSHHFQETLNCAGDFYGYATKRMSGLLTKSKICQKMAILPNILDMFPQSINWY